MEFEKTFKTDIIKVVAVFFDFKPFFIKNFQGRKSVCEKSTYYWKFGFNDLQKKLLNFTNFTHNVLTIWIAEDVMMHILLFFNLKI